MASRIYFYTFQLTYVSLHTHAYDVCNYILHICPTSTTLNHQLDTFHTCNVVECTDKYSSSFLRSHFSCSYSQQKVYVETLTMTGSKIELKNTTTRGRCYCQFLSNSNHSGKTIDLFEEAVLWFPKKSATTCQKTQH
jgi:hypothetical protein